MILKEPHDQNCSYLKILQKKDIIKVKQPLEGVDMRLE